MKKTLFFLACAACGVSMSAQVAVQKEAEKAMKNGKEYTEVLTIITPAMSDPATANQAFTYYIPGKAGFKQYDDMLGRKQLGMLKEGEGVKMAIALIGGYDNFMKALPLDSVPDEKGKIKTKYSKDIIGTIQGHYNDFTQIGAEFYNAHDFENAYHAWDIFCDLSKNADRYGIKAYPDTIVADFMFNRALAAYSNNKKDLSAKSFREAAEYGYPKEEVYTYGMEAAREAENNDMLLYFATEGNQKYGATNNAYVNNIINYYLIGEKYDDAIHYLDDAISKDPQNAQYYALKGLIFDNKGDLDKSIELYRQALEVDDQNGLANYYLGRGLCLKAGAMSDAYEGTDYVTFKDKELIPLFKEGIVYLEKAYEINPGNRDEILNALDVAYYNTEDAAGQESVKQRKLDD